MAEGTQGTILVVDDTEATRYLVTRALKKDGFKVLEAKTAAEALHLAVEMPDLITLDIQLPDMSGFEVCKRIKSSTTTSNIPVLHLSATFVQSHDKAQGLEGGADAYLTHPLEEIVLTATVRALLRTKRAESELREARSQLEKQVHELHNQRELREKFVSTLTHDLRNPLSAVKLSAEFLLRGMGSIEANQKMAHRLVNNIDRMDKMIKDLLDANRIRAGEKLPVQIDECNLFELARITLEGMAGVELERFKLISNDSTAIGYWSGDHLRRVMENLLNNAAKYGSPTGPITLNIAKRENESEIDISVHNVGNPLPRDELLKLFDPFHRASSADASSQVGWGLGLTLVRGVADAHGGRVKVESTAEAGTTFTLTLPMDSRPFQLS